MPYETKYVKDPCPQCGSTYWYPRMDGTIRCRHCPYIGPLKPDEAEKSNEEKPNKEKPNKEQ